MNRDVPPISVAPQYPVRRPRSFAPGRDAVPAAARRRISGVDLFDEYSFLIRPLAHPVDASNVNSVYHNLHRLDAVNVYDANGRPRRRKASTYIADASEFVHHILSPFVDRRDMLNLRQVKNFIDPASPRNVFAEADNLNVVDPGTKTTEMYTLFANMLRTAPDAGGNIVEGSAIAPDRDARGNDILSWKSMLRAWGGVHHPGLIDYKLLLIPATFSKKIEFFLMGYILKRLTDVAYDRRSLRIAYQINTIPIPPSPNGQVWMPIYQGDTRNVVSVFNGYISMKNVFYIYMTLVEAIARNLPGLLGNAFQWAGNEESGSVFLFLDYEHKKRLYIQLIFVSVHGQQVAGHWTPDIENLLTETVGRSVISVRNRSDNRCLLYCIVMGLIIKCTPKGSRVFGVSDMMVEDTAVYTKGCYMFTGTDNINVLIRKLSKCLLPLPDYSSGDFDKTLYDYVHDFDKEVGTMLTIEGFREKFAEIEEKLIPEDICGIDVYGIDYNINIHIYPLYISKRRHNVISILCITPKDSDFSHFCLIMNMDKLLSNSGGKQFFTCSKCGQGFYHRGLLNRHTCIDNPVVGCMSGDGGYHYSKKFVDEKNDIVVGVCTKCRLAFTDDFEYEYHNDHCLMQGRTGFRHVQLISYDVNEKNEMKGVALDMDSEEKHVKNRRILYCDFECSINQENGEHTFMSYGIYDTKTKIYKCGYTLDELWDYLTEDVCDGSESDIYVYFHNAMNYDANFLLRSLLKRDKDEEWGIKVIMKSSNRLQKLVFHVPEKGKNIHIGDTFMFLTLSLERIVNSIRKDDLDLNKKNFKRFFKIFKKQYPWTTDYDIDSILRKNIFPYNFFSESSKLDTPIDEFKKIFEPREENLKYFSEKVTLKDLEAGYENTCQTMYIFRCGNAREYHDLYLRCDVMQLTDVFERSMKILWKSHHIHLTRYIGMPSASWAAFLRYNPEMVIPLYENTIYAEFFKGMIRGGVTSAALRYAKADDRHSIIYLDVNGLYPFVMQKYKFPCGTFKFITFNYVGTEFCKNKLYELFTEFETAGNKGMCFCVDMHITDEVKRKTDMFPFAPEHRSIYDEYYDDPDEKKLTPFLQRWSEANSLQRMQEFNGLVCTLYDKEKYNVHWRLLKFYIEHGIEITKIHFGIAFDEGDYLAGYIRKNIEIRNSRTDELGKTLYKLLGNSIYGKTFESPFKRNRYEIIRNPVKLQGLIEEGNIASVTPIDNLGWVVKFEGEDIVLDKPTYIGACVCEFAKLHMYTLLYDKLCVLFPKCQLVYTDTDSFIVKVKHPEGIEGSDPEQLFAYIKSRDPELIGGIGGQVKSETGEDDTIDEIIALRSKVYAYKTKKGKIGKRAKGTTYDAQEMQLNWELYLQALQELTSIKTSNLQFSRKTFKIASLKFDRQSLSVNDGKRYICEDGIHTHAFGYPLH